MHKARRGGRARARARQGKASKQARQGRQRYSKNVHVIVSAATAARGGPMNSGGVRRSSIVAMGDPTLASTVPYAPSCMTICSSACDIAGGYSVPAAQWKFQGLVRGARVGAACPAVSLYLTRLGLSLPARLGRDSGGWDNFRFVNLGAASRPKSFGERFLGSQRFPLAIMS